MPLVYVVDDEANIRQLAALALRDSGIDSVCFESGTAVLEAMKQRLPDLLLLDWMMPQPDGLEICRRVRSKPETRQLPIILLTARSEELDKVLGLEMGADDYIAKPFGVREMPARVKAVLRRQTLAQSETEEEFLEAGPVKLYPARRLVQKRGEAISLTQKEFDLLYQLMRKPGHVLTREMLLERIWQTDYFGDTRTVDVHIRYLRQKLEDDPSRAALVLTVRGVGYCFADGGAASGASSGASGAAAGTLPRTEGGADGAKRG